MYKTLIFSILKSFISVGIGVGHMSVLHVVKYRVKGKISVWKGVQWTYFL